MTLKTEGKGNVSADELRLLTSGKKVLRLFGYIKYRDAFNVEHTTTFCSFLSRDLGSFGACSTYNYAD
jgi:hypothetical protein